MGPLASEISTGLLVETDRTTCRIPGAFDSLNVSRDVKVSGVHCRRGSASSNRLVCKRLVTLVIPLFIELRAFGKRKFGDYVVWRGLAGHLHANSVPNDLIPPVL